MDELVGTVASIVRIERDGLGAIVEGTSLLPERWPGDPVVGRSFGFGSLRKLANV